MLGAAVVPFPVKVLFQPAVAIIEVLKAAIPSAACNDFLHVVLFHDLRNCLFEKLMSFGDADIAERDIDRLGQKIPNCGDNPQLFQSLNPERRRMGVAPFGSVAGENSIFRPRPMYGQTI